MGPVWMTPGHALVVGGTGMLRGVVVDLARRGHQVSVVARGGERLASLERDGCGRVHGLPQDWHDTSALERAVAESASRHGPISLAVVWIHSSAPEGPVAVARAMAPPCRYLHVLGSSAADPSRPDTGRRARFEELGLEYREVVLGFVVDDGRSRWLTNVEIAAGVLRAVDSDLLRSVVGVVEPWSARP